MNEYIVTINKFLKTMQIENTFIWLVICHI